jgi:hypothetical protein
MSGVLQRLVLSRLVPHWQTDDVSAEGDQAPVADGLLKGQHIQIFAKVLPFAGRPAPTQAAVVLADVIRHARSLRPIGAGECRIFHKFLALVRNLLDGQYEDPPSIQLKAGPVT